MKNGNRMKRADSMIVLGVDPGIARCGYGIIEHSVSPVKLRYIECGVIETPAGTEPEQRLLAIARKLEQLLDAYQPNEVAMEKVFFFKNQKTIIVTGQTQGAIMLTLARRGYPIYQYTPLQVKQALTTYGRASKEQVQDVVMRLLRLSARPKPDDAADALAIAITHAHTNKTMSCRRS